LGHFLIAKKNGIFVTEFSVGMGPRLISLVKTAKGYRPRFLLSQRDFEHTLEWKDNTKYSLKVLPIGGSCMMLGEDETIDDDRAFNKKNVWERISVIIAGPLFNFILAFILAMILTGVVGYDQAKVSVVEDNSPATVAELMPGDLITEINGSHIDNARDLETYYYFNPISERVLNITYIRDGVEHKTKVAPRAIKLYRIGLDFFPTDSSGDFVITDNLPLAEAGLIKGDVIIKINNVSVKNGIEMSDYLEKYPLSDKAVTVTYIRNGIENIVKVTPVPYVIYNSGFNVFINREKLGITGIFKYSAIEVKYLVVSTIESIGQLINGNLSSDELAGPVRIVNTIGETYEKSKSQGGLMILINLVYISIILSANLGVMNLLPIPALDGGRLVFLLLEVFRGKPIEQTKEGIVHMIGLVALMILMVFVVFNDLSNII
jgi:regulator of sigma E protease